MKSRIFYWAWNDATPSLDPMTDARRAVAYMRRWRALGYQIKRIGPHDYEANSGVLRMRMRWA